MRILIIVIFILLIVVPALATKICPNCGKEFEEEGYEFCPDCGVQLIESEWICPNCGAAVEGGYNKCPICFTEKPGFKEEDSIPHSFVTNIETTSLEEKIKVPDILGRNQKNAEEKIEKLGLATKIKYQDTADKDQNGKVLSQTPQVEESVSKDSLVELIIGRYVPETVELFNLVGMDKNDAEKKLKEVGLEVEVEKRVVNSINEHGIVLEQNPTPGQTVSAGTTVSIVVGKYPEEVGKSRAKMISWIGLSVSALTSGYFFYEANGANNMENESYDNYLNARMIGDSEQAEYWMEQNNFWRNEFYKNRNYGIAVFCIGSGFFVLNQFFPGLMGSFMAEINPTFEPFGANISCEF